RRVLVRAAAAASGRPGRRVAGQPGERARAGAPHSGTVGGEGPPDPREVPRRLHAGVRGRGVPRDRLGRLQRAERPGHTVGPWPSCPVNAGGPTAAVGPPASVVLLSSPRGGSPVGGAPVLD